MITLEWHTAVLITVEILWLLYALSRDNRSSGGYIDLGSNRTWAIILFILGNLVIIPIYGGIFWW